MQKGNKEYYTYGGWWSVWWMGTYSMVLSKAAFFHKKYLSLYTNEMPASIRDYVTKNRFFFCLINHVLSFFLAQEEKREGGGTIARITKILLKWSVIYLFVTSSVPPSLVKNPCLIFTFFNNALISSQSMIWNRTCEFWHVDHEKEMT